MKVKHVIAILVFGWLVSFLGAFIKILHWPGANILLTVGMVLEVLGVIGFIYKLFRYEKLKEFLES